ncbi:MAG: DUF2569 domain-containing protein [Actinomycetota bacterium]
MTKMNPYAPPTADLVRDDTPPAAEPPRFGGWLLLVALGVVISPLRIAIQMFPMYGKIVSEQWRTGILSPNSSAFSPLVTSFIAGEALVNLALLVALLFQAYLFFRKKKTFPLVFIRVSLTALAILVIDAWITGLVFPNHDALDKDTIKDIGRAAVNCAIWIPYMLRSKRVKETFVN